jgi:hypothetical protein
MGPLLKGTWRSPLRPRLSRPPVAPVVSAVRAQRRHDRSSHARRAAYFVNS